MIVPNKGRLAVLIDTAAEKQGTIILPENARDISTLGTVLASGAECTYVKGDRVIISHFLGKELTLEGHKIHIFLESEVFGKVE